MVEYCLDVVLKTICREICVDRTVIVNFTVNICSCTRKIKLVFNLQSLKLDRRAREIYVDRTAI